MLACFRWRIASCLCHHVSSPAPHLHPFSFISWSSNPKSRPDQGDPHCHKWSVVSLGTHETPQNNLPSPLWSEPPPQPHHPRLYWCCSHWPGRAWRHQRCDSSCKENAHIRRAAACAGGGEASSGSGVSSFSSARLDVWLGADQRQEVWGPAGVCCKPVWQLPWLL